MYLLISLLTSFTAFLVFARMTGKRGLTLHRCGQHAIAIVFLFTGLSHFFLTEGMMMMLPQELAYKELFIYSTGFMEIAVAIALLRSGSKRLTGLMIIFFLILVFPANVYAAVHHVDVTEADFNGPGVSYLWFRGGLQILLIVWTWYFVVKK